METADTSHTEDQFYWHWKFMQNFTANLISLGTIRIKLQNQIIHSCKILLWCLISGNLHSWTVTGIPRVSKQVHAKVVEYYQQVLWGEVGAFSEHVLLWWGDGPLIGSLPPESCQLFCDWLHSLVSSGELISSTDKILFVLGHFLCN